MIRIKPSRFFGWSTSARITSMTFLMDSIHIEFERRGEKYEVIISAEDYQEIGSFLWHYGDKLDPEVISRLGRFVGGFNREQIADLKVKSATWSDDRIEALREILRRLR